MILVFGGSFDPPHLGHRNIISYLFQKVPTTKGVWIIPNYQSPLKADKLFTSEEIWNFCLWTFQEFFNDRTQLLDLELKKAEKSYTVDTLADLQKANPQESFGLVLGEDSAKDFLFWHRPSEILGLLQKVYVFRRETEAPIAIALPVLLQGKAEILDNPLWKVSSSDLRKDISNLSSHMDLDPKVKSYLISKFSNGGKSVT